MFLCPFIPSYLQHDLTFKGFHMDIESLHVQLEAFYIQIIFLVTGNKGTKIIENILNL